MAGLGAVGSRVGLSRLTYVKGKDRNQIKKLSASKELLYNGVEVSPVHYENLPLQYTETFFQKKHL